MALKDDLERFVRNTASGIRRGVQKVADSTEIDDRIGGFVKNRAAQLRNNLSLTGNNQARTNFNRGVRYTLGNSRLNNPVPGAPSITEAARMTAPNVAKNFGRDVSTFRGGLDFLNKPLSPIRTALRNTGETIGSGIVDATTGSLDYLNADDTMGKLSSAAQIARGGAKIKAAGMPLFQGGNLLSSFDAVPDSAQRLATGFTRGMSQIDSLSPNAPEQTINIPGIGDIDPLETVGSMIGFTQNPMNREIFKGSQALLPTGSGAAGWLATTASRGGIEDILLSLPEMPKDVSGKQKAKYILSQIPTGALSEIVGQTLGEAGKKLIRAGIDNLSTKQLGRIYDAIRGRRAKSRLNQDKIPTRPQEPFVRPGETQPRDIRGRFAAILKTDPEDARIDKIARLWVEAKEKGGNLSDLSSQKRKQFNDLVSEIASGPREFSQFMQGLRGTEPQWRVGEDGSGLVRENAEAAYGALAGIEPEFDEEGRFSGVGFDPAKGALGIGLAGGVKSVRDEAATPILKRLSDDFKKARELRKSDPGAGDLKTRLKEKFLDRFAAAENYDENFFMNLRLLAGGGSARTEQLVTDGLSPVLQKESGRLEGFSQLLALERLKELTGERGFKRSLSEEEINQGIKELEQTYGPQAVAGMQQSAQQLRGFLDNALQMAVRSGLISEESANAARAKNQYYVTFETLGQLAREMGDDASQFTTNSFNVAKQDVLKKIGDSESGVADPLESTLEKVVRTIEQADKNSILNDFVSRNIEAEWLKPLKSTEKPGEGFGKISLFIDGQKQDFAVPRELEVAVKNLNSEAMSTVVKIMSIPATVLKTGAVALNPEFLLVNPVRDVQDAVITEGGKRGQKEAGRMLTNYHRGLSSALGMNEAWEAWRRAGGAQSTFLSREYGSAPEATVRELAGQQSRLEKIKPPKIVEFLSRALEEGTRVTKAVKDTDFKGAEGVRKGDLIPIAQLPENVRQASFDSRNISLDFARMGSSIQTLNRIIPFFNVGIQGSDKVINLVKDSPLPTGISAAITVGVPLTLLHLNNRQYEDYKDLRDFEKQNNFVFILRDRTPEERAQNKPLVGFKLPMGNVSEIFGNSWQAFLDFTEERNPEAIASLAADLGESLSPVGLPVSGERFNRTLSTTLPQPFKTPMENFANRNMFTGIPIEDSYYGGIRRDNVPANLRYSEDTSPTAVLAGQVTGRLPGALQMSPDQLENAVGTNFGGLGKQLLAGSDTLLGSPPTSGDKVPILRRLAYPKGGQLRSDEYEAEKKVEEQIARETLGGGVPLAAGADASEGFFGNLLGGGQQETQQEAKIPATTKGLSIVYGDAEKTINDYEEKRIKIEYGDYASETKRQRDLAELDAEYQSALDKVSTIQEKYPDKVVDIQVNTYASGEGQNVESRAKWAAETLGAIEDEEKFNEVLDKMYEGNVLTKSVVDALKEDYGITLSEYVSGGKRKSYGGSGSGGIKISGLDLTAPKISTPKMRQIRIPQRSSSRASALDDILSIPDVGKIPVRRADLPQARRIVREE